MKQPTTGIVGSLVLGLLLGACSSNKASNESAKSQDKTAPSQSAGALLQAGAEAPDFTTQAHDGTTVQLSKLRGQPVVLYFYPKDETPGCTIEAQSFRDGNEELSELDATVIGVSADSLESHAQFAENHGLNFPLIVDPDGAIASKYGVESRGGMYQRVTFLIGPDGKIAKVFPEVDPRSHVDEVLAALRALPE